MSKKAHLKYLNEAVNQAEIAVNNGDEPFGTVLVLDNKIVFKGHNEVSGGDHTRHPEFEAARWAASNLTLEERKRAVVYTSGEHCPMCSAAHAWVGLGDIHYASSSKQLVSWYNEFEQKLSNVKPLSILEVVKDIKVYGPYKEFSDRIKKLHEISISNNKKDRT